ncbi:MAG TPA: hypothetical protein EYN66_18225, partial [Myxococcales bacterium]|nr:hypothetical protein [Myxococcales bacterium]
MGESLGIFKEGHFPYWGLMAQCEQTTIYFDHGESVLTSYIDLSSAMTAANRKQYHQVSTDGAALCYRVMVTAVKGNWRFEHMTNSFMLCNAVKQTAAGWKAQLRHAGIKLRNLPPYGKRPRFGLETAAITRNRRTDSGVDDVIWENSALTLSPLIAPGGNSFFSPYENVEGVTVHYQSLAAGATKDDVSANQVSTVTVTDGAGTQQNEPLVLSGAYSVGGEFNVIGEYLRARRQTPDTAFDQPGPVSDAAMLNLFSVAEESSDDIIEGIEDTMDYKPYTPDHKSNHFDETVQGGQVDSATSATTAYPPNTMIMDVPLGIL